MPEAGDLTQQRAPYDPAEFWERRLQRNYDLTGVGYRGLGEPFNRALYRQRAIVLGRAERRFGVDVRGVDVVELGPGTGFYVDLWRDWEAASVVGLDITAVATERLRARYPAYRFEQADVTLRWPIDDASADIVTAFDVLFHVVDDGGYEAAIAEAARVLRPGGHFLMTDTFPHRQTFRGVHQVHRTLDEIVVLLERHGFRVRGRLPLFVTMHPAFDAPRPLAPTAARWWAWVESRLIEDRRRGRWLGPLLGAIDRILTLPLRGGPSTELLVARRH